MESILVHLPPSNEVPVLLRHTSFAGILDTWCIKTSLIVRVMVRSKAATEPTIEVFCICSVCGCLWMRTRLLWMKNNPSVTCWVTYSFVFVNKKTKQMKEKCLHLNKITSFFLTQCYKTRMSKIHKHLHICLFLFFVCFLWNKYIWVATSWRW